MGVLEINGLKKSFGDNEVLKGISLEIQRGEVVVILGPSGCGKSTLLRCINGLEEFQAGTIRLNGQTVNTSETPWHIIRQKVGMVFQSYELFPHMSVIDNVMLGPTKSQKRNREEVREQAETLLKRVGLGDKIDSYPRQLSGGQKQRVAIVRALCMNPEIILFDEVTAALDPEMVREVLDVILELANSGMTMAIVTHEMKFAQSVADRIIFIDDGHIVEENTPDEFFENPKTERASKFLNIFKY
ncbi:MAG: amino acid ABC transporter ATP-binding protein [Clostridioides sp.]|jgi:polar amino acid transport system ATP-binding protein|nr:amino acid ABC transporter ATP-binding protein [Clostridioides sp.]